MSKVKDIIDGNDDSSSSVVDKWYNWTLNVSKTSFWYLSIGLQWTYINSRHIGWFIVTTGVITLLPLVFEIKREAVLDELEQLQIGAQLAEGRTPQELAMEGMTAAVEPKVLK